MLVRKTDWRPRLAAALNARRLVSAATGYHCGLLAGDAIEAMTGVDLAADFRDAIGIEAALARLAELGFADPCAYLAAHLPEIPPVKARHGDIMAIPVARAATPSGGVADPLPLPPPLAGEGGVGAHWSLGVCNGERLWMLTSDRGLALASRLAATRAFQVG